MKKIAILLVIMLFVCSANVFAAPLTINPDDAVSTASNILTITSPSATGISSYDKTHNISGYAASGVELSVYNLSGGAYQLMKKDDAYLTSTVGASGMFINPVSLSYGKNELLIRAEINGLVQYEKRTVTVLSFNLFNLFKGFNLF